MPEEPRSMDQNPARWLVFILGPIFCEAGIQAMMTAQVSFAWLSLPTLSLGLGVLLILLAVFWKTLHFDRTRFATRLNEIASHLGLWAAVVTVIWLSTWTLNMVKEILQNNEIVTLRNDVQSMANVINRGVMPRHLTKTQQNAISEFLSQFPPHEFAFQVDNSRDNEASGYRGDIEEALLKGGWTRAVQNPYEYTEDVPEGLSIAFIQTQAHSQQTEDPRNPRADKLLMMAFGLAGVRLGQMSGGGGPNITTDRLIIQIGPRRMDSYELTPPNN
jgi:hypothetical protein